MKCRLAVMQMRRWDWALQPRTLTFLINDGAVPKQWQLTDTVRLWSRVHTSHSHAGSYHAHASLCFSSCLLFSSGRTPVGWFGSSSDHVHAINEPLWSRFGIAHPSAITVFTLAPTKSWGGNLVHRHGDDPSDFKDVLHRNRRCGHYIIISQADSGAVTTYT